MATLVNRKAKPIAKLALLHAIGRHIRFGVLKGKLIVPVDFDAPLPDDVLAAFDGVGSQRPLRAGRA